MKRKEAWLFGLLKALVIYLPMVLIIILKETNMIIKIGIVLIIFFSYIIIESLTLFMSKEKKLEDLE